MSLVMFHLDNYYFSFTMKIFILSQLLFDMFNIHNDYSHL